jgi:hypothetical protein
MIMKSMFQLEFAVNVSPVILFPRLSTAGGLVEWFADNIYVDENVFTFVWNDMEQQARLMHRKKNSYIRFKWLDEEDDESYFEFKILKDDLTGDVALIITDFAEENEKADAIELWEKQITNLKNALGVT